MILSSRNHTILSPCCKCGVLKRLSPGDIVTSTPSGPGFDETINGLTYTVSDAFTDGGHGTGSHKHTSNNPGEQVAPALGAAAAGMAEVGGFFDDESVRGISEFDLTSITGEADTAILMFDVVDLVAEGFEPTKTVGGLYGQPGTYTGTIQVYGFVANGSEDLGDYSTTATLLGTFSASGLVAGGTVSFDLTTYFNARILASDDFLGVRLQITPEDPDASAITFENFRIDADKAGASTDTCWIWQDDDEAIWQDGDTACFQDGS